MTTEQRTSIEPKDIVTLELECTTCGSRLSYPLLQVQPDQFRRRQHSCPNCGEWILQAMVAGPEVNRVADFLEALQTLVRSDTGKTIRFGIVGFDK